VIQGGPLDELRRLVKRRDHQREQQVLLLPKVITSLPFDEAHEGLGRAAELVVRDGSAQPTRQRETVMMIVRKRDETRMTRHRPNGRIEAVAPPRAAFRVRWRPPFDLAAEGVERHEVFVG